ncbi:MAG TPA: cobaltochelatase subunit CobN, partial [Polyangiaceae bacterium]|nr:cobaltochelatase subunit CobN [Polyangiaceae bacterium]
MHILATRPGGYAAGEGVVDLGQTPGDVVILSAADTDLLLLAGACEELPAQAPSLRLASLLALRSNASVDLYFDKVLRHARVVVVALMGGVSYWPYGVELLMERAREGGLELLLVPGDDTPDLELDRCSSVPVGDCRRVWRYLREGGPDNARLLLGYLEARFFGRGTDPGAARELPRVTVYHPEHGACELARWRERWRTGAPVAALLFYRAHLQAGNLAAFDGLIAELERAGLNPLPIALASLKEEEGRVQVQQLLQRAGAELILNTTGFAVGGLDAAGSDLAALGLGRPVLQVIVSGGNLEDWQRGSSGLSSRDLAMSVVLPEVDGRIITRAVSFKGLARRSLRSQALVTE